MIFSYSFHPCITHPNLWRWITVCRKDIRCSTYFCHKFQVYIWNLLFIYHLGKYDVYACLLACLDELVLLTFSYTLCLPQHKQCMFLLNPFAASLLPSLHSPHCIYWLLISWCDFMSHPLQVYLVGIICPCIQFLDISLIKKKDFYSFTNKILHSEHQTLIYKNTSKNTKSWMLSMKLLICFTAVKVL